MKLKYYLRGIGVGLILAVAIYSTMIIPRKYRMTDEEIKNRAQELGMVQKEETDVDLSALTGTPAPDELTPPPEGELTPEADAAEDVQDTPGVTPPEKPDELTPPEKPDELTPPEEPDELTPPEEPDELTPPEEPTTMTPLPTPSEQPAASTIPIPSQAADEPAATPATPQGSGSVRLTVTYGMGSDDFAREAYRQGLVDDAAAFDQYLMQNGYALSIRVGSYVIPEGATYEEIARIVTGQ